MEGVTEADRRGLPAKRTATDGEECIHKSAHSRGTYHPPGSAVAAAAAAARTLAARTLAAQPPSSRAAERLQLAVHAICNKYRVCVLMFSLIYV